MLFASRQVYAAHLPWVSLPGIRISFVSIFDLPTQAHFVEFKAEDLLHSNAKGTKKRRPRYQTGLVNAIQAHDQEGERVLVCSLSRPVPPVSRQRVGSSNLLFFKKKS